MERSLHIPETVLSRIWAEQHFRADSLATPDGLPVQVIRRGRKNTDNGPDFTRALIRIGDQVLQGDVELHLQAADWHSHGHDTDPAYNRTILHVVFWPSRSGHRSQIIKANGESAVTVVVQPCLSAPLDMLLEHFQQTDEQKQQKFSRCQITLKNIPSEQIARIINQLGQQRIRERAARFKKWIDRDGAEQALYLAICEDLGYSSNKEPFLELARRLPLNHILTHLPPQDDHDQSHLLAWLQALLYGTAGLLPATAPDNDAETLDYLDRLHSLWEMIAPCLDLHPMPAEAWHFFHLRPANFPTRRLAALSVLLFNYTRQPFFDGYLHLFSLLSTSTGNTSQMFGLLERTLKIPVNGYWKRRYRFGRPGNAACDSWFLGQSRIRDILISAIFPVFSAYASHTSRPELNSLFIRLLNQFPGPSSNIIIQTMVTRLALLHSIPSAQRKTAAMYQGLLHLYYRYCYLPACSHCPLSQIKT